MPDAVGLFGFLRLDRTQSTPLYVQLFNAIRSAILDGALPPGTRLPSSRALADSLELGRNTVTAAYELLCVEEYLVSQGAAGTRVAALPALTDMKALSKRAAGRSKSKIRLSARGREICGTERYLPTHKDRMFAAGLPALDLFPHAQWARCVSRRARQALVRSLDYADISGLKELKGSIADHLGMARGFRPEPDQIAIVNSAQAALDLLARLLTDPGDTVWIEEPGYLGARGAFRSAGAQVRPVPVDSEGLTIPRDAATPPRIVYVTPSHQCPTGVTMSLNRRLELLSMAQAHATLIVEDDYDSEFRYAGPPISTLWSLDEGSSVIYMGTFSKTMFPGLKLGYVVVPPELSAALDQAMHHTGQSVNKTLQLALVDFLDEGRFAEHVRTMKSVYAHRRAVFLKALHQHLGGLVELCPATTGMQQALYFNVDVTDKLVSQAARERGISAPSLSRFYMGRKKRSGLFLGFASCDERHVAKGMAKLALAVDSAIART